MGHLPTARVSKLCCWQGRGESNSSPAQLNSEDESWSSSTPKLFRLALVALVHSPGLQHVGLQLKTSSRLSLCSAMHTPGALVPRDGQ